MKRRARVSVDMSMEEHMRLKTAATLMHMSMRELILECVHDGLRERLKGNPIFNEETLQIFKDTDRRKDLKWADNIDDALDKLGF